MRPQGTSQQLEKRRRRAVQLLKSGKNPSQVARFLSASRSSVYRWQRTYAERGAMGLRVHPNRGRPPKLSDEQQSRLQQILLKGALAYGYSTELWTLDRVAQVIWKEFHVHYDASAVWWLLHRLGWSSQKPQRRAKQRDEKAIAHWKRYVWPHIRKRADQLGATLIFIDESGFGLVPNVKRTWSPRGHTPILSVRLKKGQINAIGALVVSPCRQRLSLRIRMSRDHISSQHTQRFLHNLFKGIRGPIILLCDQASIHTSKLVKDFLAHYPRIQVEPFPAYAPELNPCEHVWGYADAELSNGSLDNVDQLLRRLYRIFHKLKLSQQLLWSCIYASDLPWPR